MQAGLVKKKQTLIGSAVFLSRHDAAEFFVSRLQPEGPSRSDMSSRVVNAGAFKNTRGSQRTILTTDSVLSQLASARCGSDEPRTLLEQLLFFGCVVFRKRSRLPVAKPPQLQRPIALSL